MQYSKLLSLLPAATALGIGRPQTITATYDDIAVVPALPLVNVISVYKGLNYTNFVVNQPNAGYQANTKPNVIVSGFEQTSLNGGLAMFQKTGQTKFFDLNSFYYICAVNTVEGATAVAQQCSFLVRGYRNVGDKNPVVQSLFTFDGPATNLTPNMVKAQPVGFQKLQKVDFVMVESASGETGNVLVFDTLTYNLYT